MVPGMEPRTSCLVAQCVSQFCHFLPYHVWGVLTATMINVCTHMPVTTYILTPLLCVCHRWWHGCPTLFNVLHHEGIYFWNLNRCSIVYICISICSGYWFQLIGYVCVCACVRERERYIIVLFISALKYTMYYI
jgi:hypothetical protein